MMQLNSVCRPECIKVGSRASKLALKQVEEIYEGLRFHYPKLRFNVRCTATKGDRDLKTSLKTMEATNFFTEELDRWVLQGKVRIALHSAKDLPHPLPKGLKLIALTSCLENRDVLVFRKELPLPTTLDSLRIGVSTQRREDEVLRLYPKATPVDLRGTIEARLNRLKEGDLDAVVMAKVALMRLGYDDYPLQILNDPTPPLQGSLAVIAREEDEEMEKIFSRIDFRKQEKALYLGLNPSRFLTCGPLVHCPLIKIKPLTLTGKQLKSFDRSTHLLLTSQKALEILVDLFEQDPFRKELLKQKKVIAVGQATRQYASKQGLSVDYVSLNESQEGLIELFYQMPSCIFSHLFYPKSSRSRSLLPDFLLKRYPQVCVCDLYETMGSKPNPFLDLNEFKEFIFTSSSVVNSFFEFYGDIPTQARLVFKGKPSRETFLKYKEVEVTSSLSS